MFDIFGINKNVLLYDKNDEFIFQMARCKLDDRQLLWK